MPTKDFTKEREPISFTIAPDTFHAFPAIAANTAIEYAAKFQNIMTLPLEQQFDAYREVMGGMLEPDSADRFVSRMKDKANPIDSDQLADVTMWLFEQYGLRPTTPSETSSDGQPDPEPGTSSTESTPVEVSTSELSISIAS